MHRYVFAALLAFAPGCGGDNERVIEEAKGQNCGAVTYTAFDVQNHASQDARVAAQASIAAAIAAAADDPSKAAAVFATVDETYRTAADLQAKVQGRADDHAPDDAAAGAVGAAIDADITAAIARGKAATTGTEVGIAKQIIDKSLTRFFYLSVYHELLEGDRVTYDEAYGYLGTGPKNDPTTLASIAAVARKRDDANGTTLGADLFTSIIAGSCSMDKALTASGAETMDWRSDADYANAVGEIDELMLKVLAASCAHEFFAPLSGLDAEEAKVLAFEGGYYFFAVESAMLAKGGKAATDAAKIRAMLDTAMEAIDAGATDWLAAFDSDFIRDSVVQAFGVTVKE